VGTVHQKICAQNVALITLLRITLLCQNCANNNKASRAAESIEQCCNLHPADCEDNLALS